jgi:hypothetical protein
MILYFKKVEKRKDGGHQQMIFLKVLYKLETLN